VYLDVSRDMVEVKIVGPHYVDLTLVDLPGIVRSHGKDESHTLRDEIDALIGHYLKNEEMCGFGSSSSKC
jgi:hypothetical protein